MSKQLPLPSIVHNYAVKLREESAMLSQMAGIYPGDITGSISRDAYALRIMSDLIADHNWLETMGDYDDSVPKIEVTIYDRDGNVVP